MDNKALQLMESSGLPRALLITIIIVVFLAGGAYFYFRKSKLSTLETFNMAYLEADALHSHGDYNAAVTKLQQALKVAPSKSAEANLKRKIASSLIFRNSGSDQDDAILIFKEVVDDPAMPVLSRALALSDMAFTYDLTSDRELMKRAVFNKEPYASYLRESGTGIHGALRRIYEQSDVLYPTAFARFEIAIRYAIPLLNGRVEPGLNAEQTAEQIQRYVSDAQQLITSLPYEPSVLAYLHILRAVALSASERALKNIALKDIESAYQTAISTVSESSPVDYNSQSVLVRARLFYAIDLASRFGETREHDIRELVAPIVVSESKYQPVNFIRLIGVQPANDFFKHSFLQLARISPEFRDLLSKLGWSI